MTQTIPGENGLPKVLISHPSGSSAEIYLHGAHMTSWKNASGREQLFMSKESIFTPKSAIRGGIPVIFPQFADQGKLPKHGIARTREWKLTENDVLSSGEVEAEFTLTESDETLAIWPHAFILSLAVALGVNTLRLRLRVRNTGDAPFDFQTALHTYFCVEDIGLASVHGLAGTTYIDSLANRERKRETDEAIRFDKETDRIYVNTPDTLRIEDEAHTLTITKQNMPDVVVWNPWIEKSASLKDFGNDEYLEMLCVETGLIDNPFSLSPGEEWNGETTYRV